MSSLLSSPSSSSSSSVAADAAAASADAAASSTSSETGDGAPGAAQAATAAADAGSGERKPCFDDAVGDVAVDDGGAASRTAADAGEADADSVDGGAGAGTAAGTGARAAAEGARLRAASVAEPAEPTAALDLGTRAAWEDVTDDADRAAKQFCRWRADPEVTELNLSHLGLRRFPEGFWEQAQGVEELSLVGNDLTELPAELGRLGASLRKLDVSVNLELTTLPGAALAQLTALEELNLSFAGLASLPDELFAMASLRVLDLSGCKAVVRAGPADGPFPRLGQMTNLTKLFLQRCGLRGELDAAVGGMVNLRILTLAGNPELTGISEEALGQLVNLTGLNLLHCESLVALPASIGRLTRLEELYCAATGLETLPPQIADCIALKNLYLSGCESLTHLPTSLSRCTALGGLGLSNTPALQSPPPEVVARVERRDPAPVMDYLRELDAGRLTKGAAAAGAGAAGH